MKLKLTLALPPSVNALYINQSYYNPKTRSYVATGKRILSKEGRALKKTINAQAILQCEEQQWNKETLGDDYVYMDAIVYFNRKGRDSDNIYKALQDSLEGVVYNNDTQVLVRTQKVLIDRGSPRVEITFSPVEFVGIFDDKTEANDFVANCMSCTRYRNGRCSIMRDSLEGVVKEEVTKNKDLEYFECSEFKKKK